MFFFDIKIKILSLNVYSQFSQSKKTNIESFKLCSLLENCSSFLFFILYILLFITSNFFYVKKEKDKLTKQISENLIYNPFWKAKLLSFKISLQDIKGKECSRELKNIMLKGIR